MTQIEQTAKTADGRKTLFLKSMSIEMFQSTHEARGSSTCQTGRSLRRIWPITLTSWSTKTSNRSTILSSTVVNQNICTWRHWRVLFAYVVVMLAQTTTHENKVLRSEKSSNALRFFRLSNAKSMLFVALRGGGGVSQKTFLESSQLWLSFFRDVRLRENLSKLYFTFCDIKKSNPFKLMWYLSGKRP